MITKTINTLIRIGFLSLAFALISWVPFLGATLAGGWTWALALGAASAAFYALAMPLTHKLIGLAPGACPCGSLRWKLVAGMYGVSCLQVALVAFFLPAVLSLSSWLAVFPGGFALLAMAVLSNIPTKVVESLLSGKQAGRS
jgi:hypothetical protein